MFTDNLHRAGINRVDATSHFMRGLEENFMLLEPVLTSLDQRPLDIGTVRHVKSTLPEELLIAFRNELFQQNFIPVINSPTGVDLYDAGSQIWTRLLFLSFRGTRLWDEIIQPYFDHMSLGHILKDREIRSNFIYDIDTRQMSIGVPTETTLTAKWIRKLMNRLNIEHDCDFWDLHFAVCKNIRTNFHIQKPDDNPVKWNIEYEKLWLQREQMLLTPQMQEFMKDRTLINISIDLPSPYSGEELSKYLLDQRVLQEILNKIDTLDQIEYFDNPVLNYYAQQITSKLTVLKHLSGRDISQENIYEWVNRFLKNITNDYIFIAAIKNEYLKQSLSK